MPKASRETASRVVDMGIMEGRYEELGGYTVGFETFREDADAAPLMKGLRRSLPEPALGLRRARRGDLRVRRPGGDLRGRRRLLRPPGHTPAITAGTEIIEFSPTEDYGRTMEVIARNLAATQAG
jgi:hypothetical protein